MKTIITIILTLTVFTAAYAGSLSRDDANDTVADTTNNIMWQDDAAAASNSLYWPEAVTYCDNLSLGGYTDWRLPSINELRSTMDYSQVDFTYDVFQNRYGSGQYWTSTTVYDPASTDEAWSICLWCGGYGFAAVKATEPLDVRCVRSTN